MKKVSFLLLAFSIFSACGSHMETQLPASKLDTDIYIPTAGNSWVINDSEATSSIIGEKGIRNWTGDQVKVRTFVRFGVKGALNVAIRVRVNSGTSKIKFSHNNDFKTIAISNTDFQIIPIGTFTIEETGYHQFDLQGLERSGNTYAEITDILIGGSATKTDLYYVKDEFYWGRRGPSVHLSFSLPKSDMTVKWFYNEITVPEGEDVIGSYYMANGFGEGYFGIQVNSSTERRILFSVWSPYQTDNPDEIPEDDRVQLLKKGKDVNTGEFGNEGSGGQSFRRYDWKAGTTYRFLLNGKPSGNNLTDYTAYFYAPEVGKWELIASFRRPKTNTHLTRLHSFLENFIPETGDQRRKVFFSNQWVYDEEGQWHELTQAQYTADATARKNARMDYAGGDEHDRFFLKNCGFFNEKVAFDQSFTRRSSGKNAPNIDFSVLP